MLYEKITHYYLIKCYQNLENTLKRFCAKGEHYQAEALFMALILQQQKMISLLMDKGST